MVRRSVVAVACGALIAACGSSGSHPPAHLAAPPPGLSTTVPVGATTTDVAKADDAFGLSLLGQVWAKPGNLMLSPYSVATALQMVLQGARGQTATEMLRVLRLANAETAASGLASLSRSLGGVAFKDGLTLRIADTVWVQNGLPLESAFTSTLQDAYAAALRDIDFTGNPERARTTINDAIAQQTNNRIKDLLPKGVIDTMTALVLANAVYLKADWAHPFDPSGTKDGPFHLADGTTAAVPLMHQVHAMSYAKAPGYQAVQVPFVGGRLAMTLLRPDGPVGNLLARLARGGLARALKALQPTEVDLTLPKFRFTSQFSLKQALSAMGMPTAFDSGRADLSGMTKAEQLYVSAVEHKAFVNVDERGTEAAAATGALAEGTAAFGGPHARVVFDRPFLFVITDTQTGAPLFIGRVLDPRS